MSELEPGKPLILGRKESWLRMATELPRARPAPATMADLAAMSLAEKRRYDYTRREWHANLPTILTRQLRELQADLDDIVASNLQDGDRLKGSVLVTAKPGFGKTTAVKYFVLEYFREQLEIFGESLPGENQRIPAVFLGLTSNTTMKSLNTMICEFYGAPGAHHGNAQSLQQRALDCVINCRTRIIVVDDVHFLDLNRRDAREVANHFKGLNNQFPVTWIFVGVGMEDHGLLTEGLGADTELSQIARRWRLLEMDRFEIETEPGRENWRSVLLEIEKQLVLAKKSRGMVANELDSYLFARTTGHFQSLMTLVTRGCHRAIKTGAEELTVDLLNDVKNDVAAEAHRKDLQASIEADLLSARPQAPSPKAGEASTKKKTSRQPDPERMLRDAARSKVGRPQ